jgi:hypothetical protein
LLHPFLYVIDFKRALSFGEAQEFIGETMLHFSGMQNVNKPGVYLVQKFLVCFDCGFFAAIVPAAELKLIAKGSGEMERSQAVCGSVPI